MNQAFTLIRESRLTETGGTARLYVHRETGAQLLSVCNDDENKVFGVTFRTAPADSTGVAHILEHSVLCGSRRYPVSDPFLILLQSSLQSFLNAFTFPDKTCYPVASANLQDFYNLVDVYIDAVFHPILSENTFRQEGWHLEARDPDSPWQFKGVVYNEMKGVYSSPDSRLGEECQHALFPDTLYSLDSGGDPAEIPSLTYEAFRRFHADSYHPANARFFFWGDDPEDRRLAIVDEAVSGFGPHEVRTSIPRQKPFEAPRRVTSTYAAEEGAKALFTLAWITGDRGDLERTMTLEMLDHILQGMPGSPLRKALISSGLGEDITGGLETDLIQTVYSAGLKGIAEEDIPKAEELILSTLKSLASEGIDRSLMDAALNTVEFCYRESNFGNFPRGLAAMLQALSTWLYDGDPLQALAWEAPLARIKERLAAGEKVFEKAIEELFLNNPTRATVILRPDRELAGRLAAEEAARVAARQESLDAEGRRKVCEETAALQAAQAEPDDPAAVAAVPCLGIKDLPKRNRPSPGTVSREGNLDFLAYDLPTRGIAYTDLLLPMPQLPARLLPALDLFTRIFREAGTARRDYTALGALIDARTGGVGASTLFITRKDGSVRTWLRVGGKAVEDRIPDMFEILREMLLEPLTDRSLLARRLREMLLEDKSRLEQGLVAAGHLAAARRVRARICQDAAMAELSGGIRCLMSTRRILDGGPEALERLLDDLAELRRFLTAARPGVLSCVAGEKALGRVLACTQDLLAALPAGRPADGSQIVSLAAPCRGEVFVTPSQVNYVAKGCGLKALGWRYKGSDSVILRHLSRGWLWEQVRVSGGAYGAGCNLLRSSGAFVCTSYRDPNVAKTLAAFDGIADYLAKLSLSPEDLERSIVGTIGDLDLYHLPDAQAGLATGRWLAGESDEELQTIREEILGTTAQDFRNFAEVMRAAAEKGSVCVIGGEAAGKFADEQGWRRESLF